VTEQTGEYVFVELDDVVRALSAFIAEYIGASIYVTVLVFVAGLF